MGLFSWGKEKEVKSEIAIAEPKANVDITGMGGVFGASGDYVPTYTKSFNGEKTGGELGAVIINIPDYQKLRLRAYDAYLKTDTVKIITQRKLQWVVGTGLKLEVEPNREILGMEGIELPENFYSTIEARFKVYANSTFPDFCQQQNLHALAWDCKMGADLGGDMLVVCRIGDNGYPTIQLISGEFVCNPLDDGLKSKGEGNYIEHGIEFDKKGKHVAYWVRTRSKGDLVNIDEFERIPAYGNNSKTRMAWMVYGERLSNDHKRGVPKITQILEKVNKLDRYTEASVSKAEQAANIVFTIKHAEYSTGENPLKDIIKKGFTKTTEDGKTMDGFAIADGIANKVAQTTSNTTINLPPGAEFDSFHTDIESNYEQFYGANFKTMSASMDVPKEVAEMSYNSNYSASRAAINGWGFIIEIDSKNFSDQFYKRFYQIWLETEILRNKISAPGYLEALRNDDFMVLEAYSGCRFVGKKMPHIDPVKEIKAIQTALELKLISREQAAEMYNAGDWSENFDELMEEQAYINKNFVKDDTIPEVENPVAGVERKS